MFLFMVVLSLWNSGCIFLSQHSSSRCYIFIGNIWSMFIFGAFLVAQLVKNLPVNAGDVGSIPGLEDPLEKEVATHTSILAWKIPWTERILAKKKKTKLETHSQVLPDLLKSYPITESSTKNHLPLIFTSTLTRQIDLY